MDARLRSNASRSSSVWPLGESRAESVGVAPPRSLFQEPALVRRAQAGACCVSEGMRRTEPASEGMRRTEPASEGMRRTEPWSLNRSTVSVL